MAERARIDILLKEHIKKSYPKIERALGKNRRPCDLQVGDLVKIKTHDLSKAILNFNKKLGPFYRGPYTIISFPSKNIVEIQPVQNELFTPIKISPSNLTRIEHVTNVEKYYMPAQSVVSSQSSERDASLRLHLSEPDKRCIPDFVELSRRGSPVRSVLSRSPSFSVPLHSLPPSTHRACLPSLPPQPSQPGVPSDSRFNSVYRDPINIDNNLQRNLRPKRVRKPPERFQAGARR
jgi:hypothetical protein